MEPVEPDLETRTTMRLNVFHESWNHVEHVEHLARRCQIAFASVYVSVINYYMEYILC